MSKLKALSELGQSIWFDYISRELIESGRLQALIDDGLRGMTSNPTIFMQAIGQSSDYDEKIIELKKSGHATFDIYDELTIKDVQDAADVFRPVYDQTNGLDGYVSLEINPRLAYKVEEQYEEGKRLFQKLGRENVMIKVPATPEGCLVVQKLIADGINVNVTLIFSQSQYEQVALSYFKGLSELAKNGGDVSKVRSVASVFISRIDATFEKAAAAQSSDELNAVIGKVAVANSYLIFDQYQQMFDSAEFKELEAKGAHDQRVLWASTGTKNPDYSDVKYIEELIGSPTVNTVPEKTLNAFLDHGTVANALPGDVDASMKVISTCSANGVDLDAICEELQSAGCDAFVKSFDELLTTIEQKTEKLIGA